jgi:RNA polymerase sigma-70 factor (ECF subfamily)
MNESALALNLDALVDQREFVRRLARSLLRDDAAAEDVAQDVLLAAIAQPPTEVRSLRGFLATLTRRRAANVRRSASRRAVHEARAARAETVDGSDARRVLESSQEVVTEVLALDEPYRGVLLLIYLDGASPDAIAQRRGSTAATVRSQHKRALEQLRERLDRRHGGRRDAWSFALAGWSATKPAEAALAPALVAAGLGSLLVLVGALAWWFGPWRTPTRDSLSASRDDLALASPRLEASAALPTELAASLETGESGRQAVASTEPAIDLDGRSVPELFELAAAAQSLLRERLLSVPPEIAALAPQLPPGARGGVARILERAHYGGRQPNVVGIRGGGAYYSFTKEGHSYDREPQLALEQSRLSSGFWGGGLVIDLGALDWTELSKRRPAIPESLVPAWELITREVEPLDDAGRAALLAQLREQHAQGARSVAVGRTYVLRTIAPGTYDVLVALRVIASDEHGVCFCWQLLREWPVAVQRPDNRPEVYGPFPSGIPDELRAMSTVSLVNLVRVIADRAKDLMLAVPGADPTQAVDPRHGAAVRVMRTDTFGWLLGDFDVGSYYSFVSSQREYDSEPDLRLEAQGMLDSGVSGHADGFVFDLGGIALDQLALVPDSPPVASSPLARRAWQELWALRAQQPTPEDPRPRPLAEPDRQRMLELGIDRAQALVGHTYLLRSIVPQSHDVLVAFQVDAVDEYGCTLRWRLLKRW